jgi:hypothetical protein
MDYSYCGDNSPTAKIKNDLMAEWMEREWIPQHPETTWIIVTTSETPLELLILDQFTDETLLADGYRFMRRIRTQKTAVPYVFELTYEGKPNTSTGTFIYEFQRDNQSLQVLVTSAYYNDSRYQISLACIPENFLPVWSSFLRACDNFAYPEDRVMVIGSHRRSFESKVRLEDIVLSKSLKERILRDVQSFFEQGAAVYREMNLNPFRKLLFAGVPGTGKTMMCNALANWALEQGYRAIYVSSSQRGPGETDGANFWKIQHALWTAANSDKPALIILEEFDAYLKAEEKALILNVLDGAEGDENPHGTLLIATTNYPEAIDERVLKRPGRLDRIYVVPPIEDLEQAEAMLKLYLRQLWREEHREMAHELVGYPGSFVREVLVFAVTEMVESGKRDLPLSQLWASFVELKAQIASRDELVLANQNGHQA